MIKLTTRLIKSINPYMIIIALLTIGVTYVTAKQKGYNHGYQTAQNQHLKQQQQAVARAIKQTNQINQQNAQIAQSYWQEQIQSQPKIQTIEKRIIKYVQTTQSGHCDLDDNELHILTDLTHIVNGTPQSSN